MNRDLSFELLIFLFLAINVLVYFVSFDAYEYYGEPATHMGFESRGAPDKMRLPVIRIPSKPDERIKLNLLYSAAFVALLGLHWLWRRLDSDRPPSDGELLPIDGEPIKGELLMPVQALPPPAKVSDGDS